MATPLCGYLLFSRSELATMLSAADIKKLEAECLEKIQGDELYQLRNDAKLRAVYAAKNYDEFRDIVDAAHLNPLSSQDKRNAQTKQRLWNSVSKA
ncbi:coiled-coil domain-containing protein 103 [Aedes albopictus]|uniref:Dynein attachment factor N-terminal domain-containing protein n=1 Tax=Aedes albopictus TaxID=7160 RepID=A0ABM1XVS7_AEDAL|nr:coiled-coil domain-containing protein 103-like [Aedes albopictus]